MISILWTVIVFLVILLVAQNRSYSRSYNRIKEALRAESRDNLDNEKKPKAKERKLYDLVLVWADDQKSTWTVIAWAFHPDWFDFREEDGKLWSIPREQIACVTIERIKDKPDEELSDEAKS